VQSNNAYFNVSINPFRILIFKQTDFTTLKIYPEPLKKKQHMPIQKLERIQRLPASLSTIWDFISSPDNLKKITPEYMSFEIQGNAPEKMYAGQMIQYIVKPLFQIPLSWCTEITHVKEHCYFVDEQRQGPYALWHHQHHIKAIENGVEMLDIVHYKAPLGFLGTLVTPLIVTPKLNEIFDFRFQKLTEIFGHYKEV